MVHLPFNKRPAATLAFPLSVSVLSSQYLFQWGPIWIDGFVGFYGCELIMDTRL